MKTIKLRGHIDEEHRLVAQAPDNVPTGPVELSLLVASTRDDDAAGAEWEAGIAREWSDDLADTRQDIYTLADGEPVVGAAHRKG